jgi:hypothetical protein
MFVNLQHSDRSDSQYSWVSSSVVAVLILKDHDYAKIQTTREAGR